MSTTARGEIQRGAGGGAGARWFRGDLHVHTLDDAPGGVGRTFIGGGDPRDPSLQKEGARLLLRAAVERGVRVLGLTPHAVRLAGEGISSATWAVMSEWREGRDDDGVPFRKKLFAVFPGFEPNLKAGSGGVHLLFLFDPEIGLGEYVDACDRLMDGAPPWVNGQLSESAVSPREAFRILDGLSDRSGAGWDYLCLAPHPFNSRGLFKLKGAQLEGFPHERVRGVELSDTWLPAQALERYRSLAERMRTHRQTFFHASDAKKPSKLARRYSLFNLASPDIADLRRAFLAGDDGVRLAYEMSDDGGLVERPLADGG